jgi:hypothetical protein
VKGAGRWIEPVLLLVALATGVTVGIVLGIAVAERCA